MPYDITIAPPRSGFQTVFTTEDRNKLCAALNGAEYQLDQIRGHMAQLEVELRKAEANVLWAWRYAKVEEPVDGAGEAIRRTVR